jgi:anti-sigma factor RsiW
MKTRCAADVPSLLPAYALDALDDDERERVRVHVNACMRCALELEALRASAAVIDEGQAEPPPELWGRIREQIRARQHDAPAAAEVAALPPSGRGRVGTRREQRITATAADVDLLRLTSQVSHDLLWIQTPEDATAIVAAFVKALGADVVGLDMVHDDDCIAIDISFGVGAPTFPASPRLSVARMMVEEVLPVVVEDARRAIALARERQRRSVE